MAPPAPATPAAPSPRAGAKNDDTANPVAAAAATPAPMMLLGSTPLQLLKQVALRPWN